MEAVEVLPRQAGLPAFRPNDDDRICGGLIVPRNDCGRYAVRVRASPALNRRDLNRLR